MRLKLALAAAAALSISCSVFGDFSGFSGGADEPSDAAPPTVVEGGAPDGSVAPVDASDDATAATFSDSYDRPDGPVGNGWIESKPGTFSIAGKKVVASSGLWLERILYRPPSEDVLDVEASVEVAWTSTTPAQNCDPAVSVRVRGASAGASQGLYGYATFIDDTTRLAVSRVDKSSEKPLGGVDLPQPVNTIDTYRLRFRARGTSPVLLDATFERRTPSGWTVVTAVTLSDESPERLVVQGTVALTSDESASFTYDAFSRTSL